MEQPPIEELLPQEFLDHEKATVPAKVIKKTYDETRIRVALTYFMLKHKDPAAAFALMTRVSKIDKDEEDEKINSSIFPYFAASTTEPVEIDSNAIYFGKCLSSIEADEDMLEKLETENIDDDTLSYLTILVFCINRNGIDIVKDSVVPSVLTAIAAKNLGNKQVMKKIANIVEAILGDSDNVPDIYICELVRLIVSQKNNIPISSSFKLSLVSSIRNATIREGSTLIAALGELGEREDYIIEAIKKQLNDPDTRDAAEVALKRLGYSSTKSPLTKPHHRAAHEIITEGKNCKKEVLKNAKCLEQVEEKQEWITIHSPELARRAYETYLQKIGNKTGALQRMLQNKLGINMKEITEETFTYYADEILDIIVQLTKGSKLKKDPEIAQAISEMLDTDDCKIRYATREKSDLSLGDKCGDCTAKGSINYGSSVMWLVNPAYQIVKMYSGKRFIGRMNLTLGQVNGQEALIIDAIEFNPQAIEGKPYYNIGKKCFEKAMGLIREKSKKMKRELHASRISNSSEVGDILDMMVPEDRRNAETNRQDREGDEVQTMLEEGYTQEQVERTMEQRYPETKTIHLLNPEEDVQRTLSEKGYHGSPPLYYQLASKEGRDSKASHNLQDKLLPDLEREVINPAQISNPEIAAAMRERDFLAASKLILQDAESVGKIRSIFKLPPSMVISPRFLEKKLGQIYAGTERKSGDLRRAIMVDNRMLAHLL